MTLARTSLAVLQKKSSTVTLAIQPWRKLALARGQVQPQSLLAILGAAMEVRAPNGLHMFADVKSRRSRMLFYGANAANRRTLRKGPTTTLRSSGLSVVKEAGVPSHGALQTLRRGIRQLTRVSRRYSLRESFHCATFCACASFHACGHADG